VEVSEQTVIIYVFSVVQQPLKFRGLTKISLVFSLTLDSEINSAKENFAKLK